VDDGHSSEHSDRAEPGQRSKSVDTLDIIEINGIGSTIHEEASPEFFIVTDSNMIITPTATLFVARAGPPANARAGRGRLGRFNTFNNK